MQPDGCLRLHSQPAAIIATVVGLLCRYLLPQERHNKSSGHKKGSCDSFLLLKPLVQFTTKDQSLYPDASITNDQPLASGFKLFYVLLQRAG
jgi:hypothetical protein